MGLVENFGSGLMKVVKLLTSAGFSLPVIENMSYGTRIVVGYHKRVPVYVPVNVLVNR